MSVQFPKESISESGGKGLINHGPVILVSVYDPAHDRANIITLAWSMPVSHDPPLLAISVAPERYSHNLIHKSGEFIINIPGINLIKATHFCGTNTGRLMDKFKEAGLTPILAQVVSAPLIGECLGHIECRVENEISAGDHTVFVGRVVAASKNPGLKIGLDGDLTFHHLGGDRYLTDGKLIVAGDL